MGEFQKSRVPSEWKEEHREKVVNGVSVIDGVLVGGDLLGVYMVKGETTMCTIANTKSDWTVRVIADRPLKDCMEACIEAALRLGVVER